MLKRFFRLGDQVAGGFAKGWGAASGAQLAVVVVDDQDRLARANLAQTIEMVARLEDHGVMMYDTLGHRISFDDDDSEVMTTFRALFAKKERSQARKRVIRSLRAKAESGYVCGGEVYGYRRVRCGPPSKGRDWSWVEYRVNEEEAEVVRGVYRHDRKGA